MPVTKATTRRFFFGGTLLFTLVFIGLTVHTHSTIAARTHADRIDEKVVSGLRVWGHYNCENCHTLLGEGAYYAPDLTEIVAQRGRTYLSAFLANPAAFYSEEQHGRLMPTLGLSEQEISDVLDFLAWVDGIDTNGWPPRPILVTGAAPRAVAALAPAADAPDAVSRGQAVFNGVGACASCHSLAPDVVMVGPSLAGVASRAAERIRAPGYAGRADSSEAYLRESLLAPNAYLVPGERFAAADRSFMPETYAQALTPAQIDDLVAWLATLR
jgi:nitric oxide reductase subunit C